MTKILTKKQLDDPARWRVFDRWHDAQLWGALNGIFNLAEDAKVMAAFHENDLSFVKNAIDKRIAKVGKGKPKFKKVPEDKRGYQAIEIKGSRAYAGALLNEKVFGKPKSSKKKAKVEKPKKKIKREKPPHKNPENPPNPDLPQNNAYEQARKKATKDVGLLYIYLKKYPLDYIAVYYDKKTKKKVKRKITAKLPPVNEQVEERKERYSNRVAIHHAIQDAMEEIKPVRAIKAAIRDSTMVEPKKKSKRT